MTREEIIALSREGVSAQAAFCGPGMEPMTFESFGMSFSGDGTRLKLLASERCFPTLKLIENGNRRIAITFSRPVTYVTAQVKGVLRSKRPVTNDDLRDFEEWVELISHEFETIGLPKGIMAAFVFRPDVALECEIDEFFSQTPGPKAGARV